MIDYWGLAANALWVLGLALLLAALGWGRWVAARQEMSLRLVLGRARLRRPVNLGGFLFCCGLAATGRALWERILWALLALLWLLPGLRSRRADT